MPYITTDVVVGWIRKIGSKYELRRAVSPTFIAGDPITIGSVTRHDLFDYRTNMAEAMRVLQSSYPKIKLRWRETTAIGMPQIWTAYLPETTFVDGGRGGEE